MRGRILGVIASLAVTTSDCGRRTAAPEGEAGTAADRTRKPATFVNRVWRVTESKEVAAGSLRVFLSDGTLVMADPHAKPAFGRWSYQGGRLRITEEGIDYDVDIVALSDSVFRVVIHSPGEPVEIGFRPAE